MLTWLRQSVGVRLDAFLWCVAFSHHTVGSHNTVDEFVSEVIAGHAGRFKVITVLRKSL